MCLVIPARLASRRTIRVGRVAVHAVPRPGEKKRPRSPFARGQVHGPANTGWQGDDRQLGALAEDGHCAVAALEGEILDVDGARL